MVTEKFAMWKLMADKILNSKSCAKPKLWQKKVIIVIKLDHSKICDNGIAQNLKFLEKKSEHFVFDKIISKNCDT